MAPLDASEEILSAPLTGDAPAENQKKSLKESFYAAPAPCLSLSAPTEAAKSRRLGSHLLYIRRCPISRTQHLNKTTTLVAKKRITHPSCLAWPVVWRSPACDIIALDAETLFAFNHYTAGTNIRAHKNEAVRKSPLFAPPELKMTNQV